MPRRTHRPLGGSSNAHPATQRVALAAIDSLEVAKTQPHAMLNDQGEVFYPDDDEDAAYFAEHHGARLLNPPRASE